MSDGTGAQPSTVFNEIEYDVSWTSREDYDSRCKPIVIERMKLAAHNLARMLDKIWS